MKKIIVSVLSILLITGAVLAQNNKTKTNVMKNEKDSISYLLGNEVGNYYRTNDIEIIQDNFIEGLIDGLLNKGKMDEQTKQAVMAKFQIQQQEKTNNQIQITKEKGKQFLENNKKNPDIKVTASGLQYKVIRASNGVSPNVNDKVKVHYHGTLIDGTVFDSSVERGEPIVFGLGQVIKGWTEGLQLMKTGEKFIFYIPSDLAYGDRAAGPKIVAGSTLIFEVELFEVNPK